MNNCFAVGETAGETAGESVSQFARTILTNNRRIGNIDESCRLNDENLKTIFTKGIKSDELRRLLTTFDRSGAVSFESVRDFAVSLEAECKHETFKAKVESHVISNGLTATIESLQGKMRELSTKVDELLSQNVEKRPNRSIICYNCDKPGHISRNCWLRENAVDMQRNRGRQRANHWGPRYDEQRQSGQQHNNSNQAENWNPRQ